MSVTPITYTEHIEQDGPLVICTSREPHGDVGRMSSSDLSTQIGGGQRKDAKAQSRQGGNISLEGEMLLNIQMSPAAARMGIHPRNMPASGFASLRLRVFALNSDFAGQSRGNHQREVDV